MVVTRSASSSPVRHESSLGSWALGLAALATAAVVGVVTMEPTLTLFTAVLVWMAGRHLALVHGPDRGVQGIALFLELAVGLGALFGMSSRWGLGWAVVLAALGIAAVTRWLVLLAFPR